MYESLPLLRKSILSWIKLCFITVCGSTLYIHSSWVNNICVSNLRRNINQFQWNSNQNITLFINENEFQCRLQIQVHYQRMRLGIHGMIENHVLFEAKSLNCSRNIKPVNAGTCYFDYFCFHKNSMEPIKNRHPSHCSQSILFMTQICQQHVCSREIDHLKLLLHHNDRKGWHDSLI